MTSSDMEAARPKRSSTLNVDYNLKKRRIIPSEDVLMNSDAGSSSSNSSMTDQRSNSRKLSHGESSAVEETMSEEFIGPVISTDIDGKVMFQEPPAHDPINEMTGTPLSQRPKSSATPVAATVESTYREGLQTAKSNELTADSNLRTKLKEKAVAKQGADILDSLTNSMNASKVSKKLKSTKDKDTKLFGQNDKASHLHIPEIDPDNNKENEDFCSSCHSSGIFLCCDTCPKSFHFACCNPPLDPTTLPDGDWFCDECKFKQWVKNNDLNLSEKKLRSKYIMDHMDTSGYQLFGSLLFNLERRNPTQYQLPMLLKNTFDSVYSGAQGEYRDEHFKDPLNEKQLFNAPYGQSVTRLDSYQPEHHFKQDSSELLLCYHCGQAKLGTWDHPESQRLIMSCDYCSTPWHLDCLPYPRSSMKNLGSKWKCPLHAPLPPKYKRRLTKGKQQYILLPVGSKNNGDAEIVLQRDSWSIPQISEQNVALQFLDKVYQVKKIENTKNAYQQSKLLDKLMGNEIRADLSHLLYFQASFW